MVRNLCIVCNRRRGKRWCPALNDYICSYCCGSKRGEEIRCPSNCPYWARDERRKAARQESSEQLLSENKDILAYILATILEVKKRFPDLRDDDVKEGLTLLIKTYETREKGLIYEFKSPVPQVTAISYQLGRVLEARMKEGEGYGERPSLRRVISTLKETLTRISSYGESSGGPTAFLDYLSELEREERRKKMGLP